MGGKEEAPYYFKVRSTMAKEALPPEKMTADRGSNYMPFQTHLPNRRHEAVDMRPTSSAREVSKH